MKDCHKDLVTRGANTAKRAFSPGAGVSGVGAGCVA